jgi:hypothetical protein
MKCAIFFSVLAIAVASQFLYSSFGVPGAVTLTVQSTNNSGYVTGSFTDKAGVTRGFLRSPTGTLTTLLVPRTPLSPFTQAFQVNSQGIVAGQFFDPAAGSYSGFFYDSGTQVYTTYNVPGQPQGTTTAILGIGGAVSQFCGYISQPPYSTVNAFVSQNGKVFIYTVDGASLTECTGMNKNGASVGYYNDASGVSHGYLRGFDGHAVE